MSDTTTTDAPTAWFLKQWDGDPSGYSSAARIYWPANMVAEVWDPDTGNWEDPNTGFFETVQNEPYWEEVDQATAEGWVASRGGAGPDSTGQSAAG